MKTNSVILTQNTTLAQETCLSFFVPYILYYEPEMTDKRNEKLWFDQSVTLPGTAKEGRFTEVTAIHFPSSKSHPGDDANGGT
jgi:hypothetical protein